MLNPRHGRIFITLLLSQAQEWNVEELGRGPAGKGYRLEAILPFESTLFEYFGYRRKRTYNDDSFPQGAASLTGNLTGNSNGSDNDDSFPLGAANADSISPVPPVASPLIDRLLEKQRKEWARGNTVGAWTFVFQPLKN